MGKLLKSNDLIKTYANLNNFASFQQGIGIKLAVSKLEALNQQRKELPRDGSKDGQLVTTGFDEAFSLVLNELEKLAINY